MQKRSPFKITRAVVFALLLREMRGRIGASRLGLVWVLFEPLAHVVALVAVFTVIRGRSIPGMDYPVFLLTGIIPFLLFKNVSLRIMDGINANRALFAYRQITAFDTFVARAITELGLYACVYVLIMGAMGIWLGHDVLVPRPLEWLFTLAIGMIFSFGLGLVLCIVTEAVPESRTFVRLMFMPLYFMSGIIYPIAALPSHLLPYILWIPYAHLIEDLRSSAIVPYPQTPGINLEYPAICAVVMLFIGLGLYRARRLKLVAT